MLLTERDEAIASWIVRFGPVTVPQINRRFDLSRRVGYRRVRTLRELQYLTRQPGTTRQPGVLLATAQAEHLHAHPSPRRAPHELGIHLAGVDYAIGLELAGSAVLVEREIDQHPALEDRLPTSPAGPVPAPTYMALTEPLQLVYAPAGGDRTALLAALADARWEDGTGAVLLIDEQLHAEAAHLAGSAVRVQPVDLAVAGTQDATSPPQ